MDWYVITRAGKLHRAEMKDAGDTAGPSFPSTDIADLSKYDLCERCFPPKQRTAEEATSKSADDDKKPSRKNGAKSPA